MAQEKLIDGKYEYFAFISYKEEDAEWARWLQRKLEHYKLPTDIREEKPELPERIAPIYEYKSEAGGGRLKEELWKGLTSSKYLIVICSPRSGGNKSQWLNNGIHHFVSSDREENIIPFIVEGKPKAYNPDEECFPNALLELKDDRELRGININELGRDAAAVKVVSSMFDVKFDKLWQRYEREQKKKKWMWVGGATTIAIVAIVVAVLFARLNHKMNVNMSRILAEKASELIDDGDSYTARLLALEALPPVRPYTVEADAVLRKALQYNSAILRGHSEAVTYAAFSPDDKYIVSGSKDNTIRIWDSQTGQCVDTLMGHSGDIDYVAFSPDGTMVFSSARDSTARIWNIPTGQCSQILKCVYKPVHSAVFRKTGRSVAFSSEGMGITSWNIANGSRRNYGLPQYDSSKYAPVCEEDGHLLTATTTWKSQIEIYDVETNETKQLVPSGFDSNCLAVNPTGDVLVAISKEKEVLIWNLKERMCLHKLKDYRDYSMPPAFSNDGTLLAILNYYGVLVVMDVKTGLIIKEIDSKERFVFNQASFSHDNCYIMAACNDGTIRKWDIMEERNDTHIYDGADTLLFRNFTEHVRAICPNGKYEASVQDNNTIQIIDANDKTNVRTLKGHTETISSISFSPDGRLLASASWDTTIRLWDVKTGKCVKILKEGNFVVNIVRFSSNGKMLLSQSGEYGSIRVWDVSTGYCLLQKKGFSMTQDACFSNGDKTIIVKLIDRFEDFDFPSFHELIEETRERFKNRPLTPVERQKYYLE